MLNVEMLLLSVLSCAYKVMTKMCQSINHQVISGNLCNPLDMPPDLSYKRGCIGLVENFCHQPLHWKIQDAI